ncbi:MAG: tripartite tricarboxylate transporter substrate binding protein [Deltaproteobacteria bacterium]|nr:tripartite tricarboxylate transporter substrate binding protein [Deltaproteobacteria bacterium]
MKRKVLLSTALAVVSLCLFAGLTRVGAAEKFPSRPIELVCGFAPGGAADMTGRLWARILEKYLGVPVIPVNKPGAGGALAFTHVANARPDGYTLLNTADWVVPVLMGTAGYKAEDLVVVAQVQTIGNTLCVPADAPWKTFQEFVDYAKKNPGVKYANQGAAAMITVRMENLNRRAGLKLIGVPLKGDGEILPALLGKHVPIATLSVGAAKPQIEAGKLRALFSFDPPADFGLDPSLPDFDSFMGKNIPDIEIATYIAAPKNTPKEILQVLESAIQKASKDPELIAEAKKIYFRPAFVPGKTVMEEKIPAKFGLIKEILQASGQIK